MELSEPQGKMFSNLINEIETGQIKIPQFQRNFVWTIHHSAALIDSMIKGFPIGTFIMWRTKESLRSVRNIGGIELPDSPKGESVDFVLDGQQRLTSLFASLKGAHVTRDDGKIEDFSKIYINLLAAEDEDIVLANLSTLNKDHNIKLTDLLYSDFIQLGKYPREHYKKLKTYQQRITSYNFSLIQIKEAPIDVATEIFTRINVGGKSLSVFEIMVAKTYDSEKSFDLSEKYDNLIEKLEEVDYETISDMTILQVISIIMTKDCTRKIILKLKKELFISVWDEAISAIKSAVDYFRNNYRIPVSKLLPYNALIVPFAYFFYKNKDKPTGNKQKYLEDYFWRCSLSGRFTSGTEGKLAQDIKKIDDILQDKLPQYDWSINSSPEFIMKNGAFSVGKSYIKAILCIFAYMQPKSFRDDSLVTINNAFLKQANSKNYHHFFPRSYLKKNGIDEFKINHILNITIVDDYLNKNIIKAKAPSVYMNEFSKTNSKINETMSTHLIDNIESFGILDNNYEKFFEQRAILLSNKISERLIPQDIDKSPQPDVIDDPEELIISYE